MPYFSLGLNSRVTSLFPLSLQDRSVVPVAASDILFSWATCLPLFVCASSGSQLFSLGNTPPPVRAQGKRVQHPCSPPILSSPCFLSTSNAFSLP